MKIFRSITRYLKRKASSYEGAGFGRRLQRWSANTGSMNTTLLSDLGTLQARSRDMVRNNPYASNILGVLTANAIGTGIKPQSTAPSAQKEMIDPLWLAWTDEADQDGRCDFYGLQSLILRSVIESGECLVRFRLNRANRTVPLQLQVIASEILQNTTTLLPN